MSVTEASPMNDPQVLSMLDNLRQLSTQIKAIDAELGVDATGPIAQRNKIASQYIEQYGTAPEFQGFLDKIDGYLGGMKDKPELLSAVFVALNDRISKNFGKIVKDQLDAEVAKLPKTEAPTISDERKTALANERTKKVGIFKAQKEMLKFYDVLTLPTDIEEPPVRRGSIGPRGAQFTKTYQYYLDGKLQQLTDTDGVKSDATLSNIATKLKKELNWTTKDLRDKIMAHLNVTANSNNEVDLPDTWEFPFPAPVNKTLRAVVTTTPSVDESDDGDETTNGTDATDTGEDMFASA
jgi:hypothetical protein